MATKLQKESALSRDTMNRLTHSTDEWLRFLDSAAWLYKYPWHEQVMIYAQRPDATACAPHRTMELTPVQALGTQRRKRDCPH